MVQKSVSQLLFFHMNVVSMVSFFFPFSEAKKKKKTTKELENTKEIAIQKIDSNSKVPDL